MDKQILDPYKELGVGYNTNLVEIRNHYKKLALKHHPDRGGDRLKFERLKSAYIYLYKYLTNQKKQLQRESTSYEKYSSNRNIDTNSNFELYENVSKKIYNPKTKRFDSKRFNNLYEQVRIKDANDDGYGDGSDFDPNKNKNLQIQKIHVPKPIDNTGQYQELGQGKINDFGQTKNGSKSAFTDYNRAFINEDITSNPNDRKNYKDVNDLKNERSNISYKMNKRDKKIHDRKLLEEKKTEELRRYRDNLLKTQQQKTSMRLQNYLQY